jgi:integrase
MPISRPIDLSVSIGSFQFQMLTPISVAVGMTLEAFGMIDNDLTLRNWTPQNKERPPGYHSVRCDARGLYVRMFDTGAITWVFRYKLHGKSKQTRFGPYPAISLASARKKARDAYTLVKEGIDPVADAREKTDAAKAQAARQVTFEKYVKQYMTDRQATFKSAKQAKLWEATLSAYAIPVIGKINVNDINEQHVQQVMEPIYNTKRETTRKVVQRISAIMGAAMDDGHRDRDKLNPARPDAHTQWRTRRNAMRKDAAGRRGKHPAIKVAHAPAWFAALRAKEGVEARALEFLALTAVRSGEVRSATWDDIDFEHRVWEIPVEASKMSRDLNRTPHRVPLSDAALALLSSIERRDGVNLVFPAARDGELRDHKLSQVMSQMHKSEVSAGREGWIDGGSKRPAVPHGLRATCRTWCSKALGSDEFEVAEAVLAHAVGGTTSLAYQRGNYFEQRVPVMQAWSDYLTTKVEAPAQADPLAAALAVLRDAGLSGADIAARLAQPAGDNVIPIRQGAA